MSSLVVAQASKGESSMMISQTGIDFKLGIDFFDYFETYKVEVSFGARALMSEPEIGCDKSCAGRGAVL